MKLNRVKIDPCNRAKIAFITHQRLYFYNVRPVGICNAYATLPADHGTCAGSLDRDRRPVIYRQSAKLRRNDKAADRNPFHSIIAVC